MHTAQGRFLCAPRICRIQAARGRSYERRVMENVIGCRTEKIQKDEITSGFYRLFWIYVICGVAGFFIESLWCWIDFGEFTSRTSDMFFPISCVWGLGGVLVQLFTVNNRWSHPAYIFLKCTVVGAGFEFLCGYLGEHLLQVTFWDYSGVPFHIGKYINLPFCLVWGGIGVLWVRNVYPLLEDKMENRKGKSFRTAVRAFVIFLVSSQVLTGAALLRMHERQQQKPAGNYAEYILDRWFTDQTLQQIFPKMKSTVTGEKIYGKGN